MNTEVVPPHPSVGADGNDPIHPDNFGPPPEDDVNMPPGGANDSGEQDDDSDWDMDDPNLEPPPSEQPPYPPHPPLSMPPSIPQQPMFSNPDETVEKVIQPVGDEESSSEEPHLTEPERIELKQREVSQVSHHSDEKPPKAKAKVQIKKQKVQLPGHQNPIEVPTVKPPKDEEDDEPHPNASSSNDPTIPLPTTTPHSFTPAQPEDEAEYDTPQSSQDTFPYQDVETRRADHYGNDVEHLNSNGSHDTQPYDSELFVKFEGDYL